MDETQLREEVQRGMSINDIAAKYDVSYTNVRYWLSKFNLKTTARSGPKVKGVEKGTCLNCRVPLVKNKVYCSLKCQAHFRTQGIVDEWLSGNTDGSNGSGELSKTIRTWLIRQAGNACEECGWNKPNPVLGYPILTIDHIDGDWSNNKQDKLKVLCYNCHTLTPTFGTLNLKNEKRKSNRSVGTKARYSSP